MREDGINRGKIISKKKTLSILLISICLFLLSFSIQFYEKHDETAYRAPRSDEVDLSTVFTGTQLSKEDYQLIQLQSGLGRIAVDELLITGEEGIQKIRQCQKSMYNNLKMVCEKIGWVTYEERIVEASGDKAYTVDLPNLKNGDVLISRNTHTMGWRHGHAAIVIDAKQRKTLECVVWGEDSCIQNIDKWREYPSFLLLRLKEAEKLVYDQDGQAKRLGDVIADYAVSNLNGLPYGLLSGIPIKSPKHISKTQCAHLIWYAYDQFGYDVDGNGGFFVIPENIVESGLFDMIQFYGLDPDQPWN